MTPHQALAHPGPREDALRHRHSTGFPSPGTGLLRPNASVMAVTEGGPDSPEQQETLGPERLIGLPHVTEVARAEPGPTLSFCSVKLSDMGNVSKRLWTQIPRVYSRDTVDGVLEEVGPRDSSLS